MNHRVSPKAGTRRTHAERSAATRQHLIATAIDVIQHRSLEEMSIHELAKSAGMTSGAVQHHFESKAVLMMNVLSELIESTVRSGELWPSAALPARERAAKFVQAVWRLVYAQPRFIVAWNIYLGCRNQPEVLGHIAELRQSVQARMHEGFFSAFPELAAEADRDGLLGLVLSSLRGLGLLQLFAPAPPTVPDTVQQAQLACLADWIATRCEAAVPSTAAAVSIKARTRRR
ncbi:TetR/AcrR family transcriptional regulator [Acidovorax delafieldii]|uniref:TetR/AcrR family transcriptional regulator n=1 Tax=Acidovorax delafieldii TaxID=47920 RepID=UPI003756C5DF